MFSFFQRRPAFGIEITSQRIRTVAVSYGGGESRPVVGSADLPAGAVSDSYSVLNSDPSGISRVLLQTLQDAGDRKTGRAGLCLPDSVFRIQTLDFDEFPTRSSDQERLIRWRLEKTAAFDLADTLLQHQVLRRPGGLTVLACIAKKAVIEQYEAVLAVAGLEVWSIVPSSLAIIKLYASALERRSRTYALTHVTGDSIATIVVEQGAVTFYRFKEVKRSTVGDMCDRLARDISDSLHFYMHKDRTRQADLQHLYLNGDAALCDALARELSAEGTLDVQILSPGNAAPHAAVGQEYAAALGVGFTL